MDGDSAYVAMLLTLKMDSTRSGRPSRSTSPQKLHLLPTREVAEELSLMDAEILRKISPDELKNGAWMDKSKKHELAPNVMAMVGSFNRLALLVPTEILQEKTPQMRAKVISTFIQLASKCYSLKNYNSLKAILAGLQCTPVYRLKKTWKEVPSKRRKRFDRLSMLMSEEDNWELYRKDLDCQIGSNVPSIPFLGVFLTQVVQQESYDMMKLKESIPDKKKPSVYETYTILDAITVRNTLEKMNHRVTRATSPSFSSPTWSDSDEESPRGSPEKQIDPESHLPRLQRSPLQSGTVERDGLSAKGESPGGSPEVQIDPESHLPRLQRSPLQNGTVEPTAVLHVGLRTGRYQVACQTIATKPRPAESSSSRRERLRKLDSLDLEASVAHYIPKLAHNHPSMPALAKKTSTGTPSDSANEKQDSLSRSRSVEDLQKAFRERDIASQLTIPHFQIQQVGSSSGSSTELTEDSIPGLPSTCTETPLAALDSTQSLPIHLTSRRSPFSLRRRASPVVPCLRVAQLHPKTPNELLQRYQFLSLGCCAAVKCRPELRTLLAKCPHNTEAQNYKLSCEREPNVVAFNRSTHTHTL